MFYFTTLSKLTHACIIIHMAMCMEYIYFCFAAMLKIYILKTMELSLVMPGWDFNLYIREAWSQIYAQLPMDYFRSQTNIFVYGHNNLPGLLYEFHSCVQKHHFSHIYLSGLLSSLGLTKRTSESKPQASFAPGVGSSVRQLSYIFRFWNIGLDVWFLVPEVYQLWPKRQSLSVKFCTPSLTTWNLQVLFCL